MKPVNNVVTHSDSIYLNIRKGVIVKGEGYLHRYKTIGLSQGSLILDNVTKAVPPTLNNSTVTGAKRGFMTLGSVIGNGRFRDRGVSEDLLLKLFSSQRFLKRVQIEYKAGNDDNIGTLAFEPIVNTQSLQKELSNLKAHVTLDKNGVTGTLNYLGVSVQLNAAEMQRMRSYI